MADARAPGPVPGIGTPPLGTGGMVRGANILGAGGTVMPDQTVRYKRVDAVQPSPLGSSSGASASEINKGATTIEATSDMIAGANNVLPVVYGGPVKLGPLIVGIVGSSSGGFTYLYLTGLLSHGPIESIDAVVLDDKPDMTGMTFEPMLGLSSQVPMPSLVSAYAEHGITYADAMPGVAYVNIKLSAGMPLSNVPRVAVTMKGRKVLDMRTGITAWSANPTLCLADFIKSKEYGAGKDYDVDSFKIASDFNDAVAAGTAEPSRLIALALTNKQTVDEWVKLLAVYANVEIYQVGGKYYVEPRRAKSSTFIFNDANVVRDSVQISRLPMRQVPTISTVKYTDTTVIPWSTRDCTPAMVPGVDENLVPARDSTVSLPGITRATQAAREALERLNWNIYGNTSYQWTSFDDAAAVRKGHVVTFSHAIGISNRLIWINDVDDQGFGRYLFKGTGYDPAIFSGVPPASVSPIDSSVLIPGLAPPAVTAVHGAEELYQKQNGVWDSRVRFEWTASGTDVSFDHFALAINDVTNPAAEFQVDSRNTTLPSMVTYALQEGRQYRLYVMAVSVLGISGPVASSNVVNVLGKLAPPGDVPGFAGTEAGGTVYLKWGKAIDLDVVRYEVRRGAVGSAWDAKTQVAQLDALAAILPAQPEGTQEYSIKAIDSVGKYSVNPATISIVITIDSGSVLVSYAYHTYLPTNMQLVGAAYYTINLTGMWQDGADVPDNSVGTFNDSLKDNLIGFPTDAAASQLVTDVLDQGSVLNGRWSFTGTANIVDSLAGAPFNDALITRAIDYSTDNVTFTPGVPDTVFSARYVRLRATCPTGYVMRALQDWVVNFSTTLREERGTATVDSSGRATVVLTQKYARYVSIQLTVQSGGAGRFAVYDNVIVGTGVTNKFDIVLFTAANAATSGTVAWTFQGLN